MRPSGTYGTLTPYLFGITVWLIGWAFIGIAQLMSETSAPPQAVPPTAAHLSDADVVGWRRAAHQRLTALFTAAGFTGAQIDHPEAMREFDQGRSELGFRLDGLFGSLRLVAAADVPAAVAKVRAEAASHCDEPPGERAGDPSATSTRADLLCRMSGEERGFAFLGLAAPGGERQEVISLFHPGAQGQAQAAAVIDRLAAAAK